MVARAPDVPSYAHLILPSQEEEFVGLSPGPVYYDLSQSCCPRSGGGYGGGRGGVDGGGGGEMSLASGGGGGRTTAVQSSPPDSRDQPSKKRKAPSTHEGSDDDTGDDCKSVRTDDHKKQNHSEIEKRRRDKMNTYITELSAMVPMCHALSRKLDKLTVLRMAVQHMKAIRGAVASYTDGSYKPAFLSDLHLKKLIKQAAEGFLFVVGCDRGRILYVSESVSQSLNYTQSDLLGQSWFDILHPKDVAKVKEQLSSSHLSPRERFIDAKTMLPVKTEVPASGARLSPGARRSFFCRMKCRSVTTTVKEEADTTTGFHRRKKQQAQHVSDKKYRVIHCTGYLKPWGSGGGDGGGGKLGGGGGGGRGDEDEEKEGESSSLSCLVAMGRVVLVPLPHPRPPHRSYLAPISLRPLQFISRHAMDGKFLFVDQRATLVLGFLPQELLGTSMYEYYYKEDICHLAESHKAALQSKEPVTTKIYRFRSKDGNYVQLQSEWRSFRNPWTKEGEYLVAKNSRLTTSMDPQVESSIERTEGSTSQASGNYEYFSTTPSDHDVEIPTFLDNGSEIPKFISSNVEASHIGRQISEEVQDELRKTSGGSPSSTNHGRTPSPSVVHQTTTAGATPGGGVVGQPPQLLEEIMSVLVTINRVGKVNPKWDSVGSYPYPLSPPASLEGRRGELETKLHSGIFPDRVSVSGENSSQSLCQRKGTTEEASSYPAIRNNVTLSSLGSDTGGEGEEMLEMMGSAVSPPEAAPSDGNDEAAMAVIMCLLEADAGLGGPVDFTGLPWPLP